MTGALAAFATGIVLVLSPTVGVALGALCIEAFAIGFLLGPSFSLLVSLSAPNARGSTLAVAKLVSMLVGNAAISWSTGAVSDAIGGRSSIQAALAATLLGHLWAGLHYFLVRRTVRPAPAVELAAPVSTARI